MFFIASEIEKTKGENNKLEKFQGKGWKQYGGFSIHEDMLDVGIIAIKPDSYKINNNECIIRKDNDSFPIEISINRRNLKIYRISNELIETVKQKKNLKNLPIYKEKHIKEPEQLLKALMDYVKENTAFKEAASIQSVAFVGSEGEVFLPCHINNSANFYIFPRASESKLKFTGFNTFVTAGSMLGLSLRGIDALSFSAGLLNPNIKFHPNQKFFQVSFNESECYLYEAAALEDLKKLTHLIKATSTSKMDAKLVYHLPYYDYLLLGIKLFIHNKIKLEALTEYFEIIIEKAFQLAKTIKKICEKKKISVSVISPFDSMFGELIQFDKDLPKTNDFIEKIFKILNIPFEDEYPEKLEDSTSEEEKTVEKCINLLQESGSCSTKKKVWKDFIDFALKEKNEKLDFEDLFRVGDSFVIALSSFNEEDNKVCSFLPLSEGKQTQLNYEKFYKNHNEIDEESKVEKKYPLVFNLTYMNSVLGYSQYTKIYKQNGLMFYFGHDTDALSFEQEALFEIANGNIGLFSDVKNDVSNSKKHMSL